jgi:hypothetical protein
VHWLVASQVHLPEVTPLQAFGPVEQPLAAKQVAVPHVPAA